MKTKKIKSRSITFLKMTKRVDTLIRGVSDFDGDGVQNWKDCQSFNRKKQDKDIKILTYKGAELIQKSLLKGRKLSRLTYLEFANLAKARVKRFPFIKVVRGYGIYGEQDKTGQVLYNAIDMKTGLLILGSRDSLEEVVEDIHRGVPEQLRKERPELHGVRATYELIRREAKISKEYGNRAKRFKKYPGQKVLDIGAGDNPDFRATHAIDLEKPTKVFSNLNYKWGYDFNKEKTNLPYKNNVFDVVVSYGALGRNFESANIYKEIYRVLKKGGHLEFNPNYPNTKFLLRKAGFEKPHMKSYLDEFLNKNISVVVTRKI